MSEVAAVSLHGFRLVGPLADVGDALEGALSV